MIPFILKYSYSFRERSEFLLIITLVEKYASIIKNDGCFQLATCIKTKKHCLLKFGN